MGTMVSDAYKLEMGVLQFLSDSLFDCLEESQICGKRDYISFDVYLTPCLIPCKNIRSVLKETISPMTFI